MAERLQGTPFHLIATHTHGNVTKSQVLAFVQANGLGPHASNFTITKNGSHSKIKGNGILVPYSAVFDHTGTLVYEHMTGSYHGGNEWKMIEYVDAGLPKVPAVYVGAKPYVHVAGLAKQVASGRGLAKAILKLESLRATSEDPPTKTEVERLLAAVTRYRDRTVADALALEGTRPSAIASALRRLAKALKGTSLAADVETKLAELEASRDLQDAIVIEKGFRKVLKSWNKLKEKKRTEAVTSRAVKKLEKLIEGHPTLAITATVNAFLADLR